MSDFGETFSPIAAKDHRCAWCYWPIPKGEKHKHFQGKCGGDWQNLRFHDECHAEQQESAGQGEPEFTLGCADPPERIKTLFG